MISQFYHFLGLFFNLLVPVHRNYCQSTLKMLCLIPQPDYTVPVEMHVFHISSIVLVPWSSCLGGYLSVPDDYPLVLVCEEHVSTLGIFVA